MAIGLLSLEKADDESPVKVRYFETLDTANEACLSRASKLLEICGLDAVAEGCNTFRQSGDDCTWWVLHYIEAPWFWSVSKYVVASATTELSPPLSLAPPH